MSKIIIEIKSNADLELIIQFAEKLGVDVKRLPANKKKDLVLGALMDKIKTGENVSRKTILKKLI